MDNSLRTLEWVEGTTGYQVCKAKTPNKIGFAFLVGVSDYSEADDWDSLGLVKHDIHTMAEFLTNHGYETYILFNLDYDDIHTHFSTFIQKINSSATIYSGFIYLAGHGEVVKSSNNFIYNFIDGKGYSIDFNEFLLEHSNLSKHSNLFIDNKSIIFCIDTCIDQKINPGRKNSTINESFHFKLDEFSSIILQNANANLSGNKNKTLFSELFSDLLINYINKPKGKNDTTIEFSFTHFIKSNDFSNIEFIRCINENEVASNEKPVFSKNLIGDALFFIKRGNLSKAVKVLQNESDNSNLDVRFWIWLAENTKSPYKNDIYNQIITIESNLDNLNNNEIDKNIHDLENMLEKNYHTVMIINKYKILKIIKRLYHIFDLTSDTREHEKIIQEAVKSDKAFEPLITEFSEWFSSDEVQKESLRSMKNLSGYTLIKIEVLDKFANILYFIMKYCNHIEINEAHYLPISKFISRSTTQSDLDQVLLGKYRQEIINNNKIHQDTINKLSSINKLVSSKGPDNQENNLQGVLQTLSSSLKESLDDLHSIQNDLSKLQEFNKNTTINEATSSIRDALKEFNGRIEQFHTNLLINSEKVDHKIGTTPESFESVLTDATKIMDLLASKADIILGGNNKLINEKENLISEKENLISEKENLISEKKALEEKIKRLIKYTNSDRRIERYFSSTPILLIQFIITMTLISIVIFIYRDSLWLSGILAIQIVGTFLMWFYLERKNKDAS